MVASVAVRSVEEPISSRAIRLVTFVETTTVRDVEQVTASSDNKQNAQYVIAPTTPSPPSYHKVIDLFSQGMFSDCANCSNQKCVFYAKYCTQCGYSLVI